MPKFRVLPVVVLLLVAHGVAFAEKSSGDITCPSWEGISTSSRTRIYISDIELHYEYDVVSNSPSAREGLSWSVGRISFDGRAAEDQVPARMLDDLRIVDLQVMLIASGRASHSDCMRITPSKSIPNGPSSGVNWAQTEFPAWDDFFSNCSEERTREQFDATFDLYKCTITTLRLNTQLQHIEDYLIAHAQSGTSSSASENVERGSDTSGDADARQKANAEEVEFNKKLAEANMRIALAEQQRAAADPDYAMRQAIEKMDPTSKKAFMAVLLGVMTIAVGALVITQIADDSENGAIFAGITSGMLTSGGAIGAMARHIKSPSRASRSTDTVLRGEPSWFSTGSYRFAFLAGGSSLEVSDDSGDIYTSSLFAIGAQGVLRYSALRLSLSTLYRDGSVQSGSERHNHDGIETGLGVGIQLWRGGLLSPYAEIKFATYASSTGDLMAAALDDDITGIDYVVGNTFTFRPLGFREQGSARSRFFLDLSYVIRGRLIANQQFIFALGFDRAW